MSSIPTLWFDKDGVLAQYDYGIYEAEDGAPAPWLIRNTHVFRTIEPYENMCEAFRMLYAENCEKPLKQRSCNIKVLTGVSAGITLSEHVLDGYMWCKKTLGLKERDFYACALSKESVPVELRSKLTPMDILLDDYNPNLVKWKNAGGTAIKVLNGINSINRKFPWIHNSPNADYIYSVFQRIIEKATAGELLECSVLAPKARL